MAKLKPINCGVCGKPFIPAGRNCKYCSEQCRETQRISYSKAKWQEKKAANRERLGTRICLVCGTEFAPKHGIIVTCSQECQAKRNRQKSKSLREEYKSYKAETKEKEKAKMSLSEANRRARELGLSYGKYMEQLEIERSAKHGY